MCKHALVVDDDESVAKLIWVFLKNRGFVITLANNGETALRLTKSLHPDLVILDVMLPGRDGFEVCSLIKEDPKTAAIPVIILTGITAGSAHEDEYWRLRAHADAFLSKPFRLADLAQRVESLVGAAPGAAGP